MYKYRIRVSYLVEVPHRSKVEARKVFNEAKAQNKEDEYLEYISIHELTEQQSSGWRSALKEQLLPSSKTKR